MLSDGEKKTSIADKKPCIAHASPTIDGRKIDHSARNIEQINLQ